MILIALAALVAQAPGAPPASAQNPRRPFVIKIVDDETLRGIPLVELRTVNHVRYVTDSAGRVAIDEPGLVGQETYFSIAAFGYFHPTDKFGNSGTVFKVEPGRESLLAIHRINLAERIYRVTGEGIYRDTVLAGQKPPIREPLLSGKVFGSDSVLQAIYHDKLYWFWGDTNRPSYPFGNFDVSGATSLLPSSGGLDPDVGVEFNYFVDPTGFARAMAPVPGQGPTWITGLIVLKDKKQANRERMFAYYEKIRNDLGPNITMEVYQRGLVEFDDQSKEFRKIAMFNGNAPAFPAGHPFLRTVQGVEYAYFGNPFPVLRVKADPELLKDLSNYESFTPLVAGSRVGKEQVDRDANGKVAYGWKRDTPIGGAVEQLRLQSKGLLKSDEVQIHLRDETTSKLLEPHFGSLNWNPWRNRWVAIFVESGGTSYLGEVWYAEADTPFGPWLYARKVVTHARKGTSYSFYSPKQHAVFDKDKSRTIFFEGTYSTTFSGNVDPTPRYDYNQVMYKLDLARPEMALPVPVYELSDLGPASPLATSSPDHPERLDRPIPYYALDRPTPRTMPIREYVSPDGARELKPGPGPGEPVFHILPYGAESLPATTAQLLEFLHDDGRRHAYSLDPNWTAPGYRRTGRVLGYVWRNPSKLRLSAE